MKRIIKDYFTFSKKERVAITLLLLLMACFIAMPYFYAENNASPPVNKALEAYLGKSQNASADSVPEEKTNSFYSRHTPLPAVKKESFPFDPNTIVQEDWQRLGVSEKTARTIIHYRSKGGRFRTPEDLRKIWGIRKEDAERLIPFVRIGSTAAITYKKNGFTNPQPAIPPSFDQKSFDPRSPIDVNTATEEEWKALPGIGDVLARRILKFRERAGGFTSIEQVGKTYGLADSVFQHIGRWLKINTATVPKLDLNLVSAYDLRRRLNIGDTVVRAIIAYRKQYGAFQSVEELKKIVLVSDTLFQRVAGFVKVE